MTETDTCPTDPRDPGRARSSPPPLVAGAIAFGECRGLPRVGSCCSIPAGAARPCPSCGEIGPIVGVAPVRPHRIDAADGEWQHCPTAECRVVYYLDATTVDSDAVITQIAHKATNRPMPVCFCFAHTADDLVADAASHDGTSMIKAAIKQAVADGHCACEHLNPSTKCCLADIQRTLKAAATATEAARVSAR